MKNISPDQKKDAEAQWRKANPGLEPTTADITGQVYQTLYNRAMLDSGMGTGGAVQQGISAATAAIQGLAGGSVAQALSGAAAPYLAEQIHKLTTTKGPDGKDVVNVQANLIAHAVVGAVTAYASGNAALAGASGAAMGEYIAQQMYPGVKREDLSEEQRQTISALGTLAAGLAGGIAGDSAGSAVAGAQAGRNAVENNALHAEDEKQRQDAKWSLPYLEGEKKQQAEQLISDLNAKDKAFDAALDLACKGLSSAACQGMRQELAVMGKSYSEQLDGQYIGNLGSVYKEGKGQVDALMWQYATADAKADRDANVSRIAENWGVSKETADGLYTAMAGVHTTAAIGGAVYGMKGSSSAGKVETANSKTINNEILDNPRVGTGEKGKGSGNKIDPQPNKVVTDINGKEISIYSNDKKPFATQEFSAVPKAHGFNDIVDNYAGYATKTNLNNGATLYQLEGSLNGVAGRFEWIVDPKLGGVSHRMFVSDGKINGVPSKP